MSNDVGLFFAGIAIFVLYLMWSAATEMGTKWPWR